MVLPLLGTRSPGSLLLGVAVPDWMFDIVADRAVAL